MAQTNYTIIQNYYSTTPAAAPSAGNLSLGELAFNAADVDMALYAKNATGTVKRLMNNPAGLKYPTADGTANQLLKTDASGNLTFTTPAASTIANTPSGAIAATDVQAALNELDTDKQEVLVSGVNIKTVVGQSIVGAGDIAITAFTSPAGSIYSAQVLGAF